MPVRELYPWNEAVAKFFNWLQNSFPQGVILVAHNAFASDARILIRDLKRSGRGDNQIENVIHGFCDTLVAFRTQFTGMTEFCLTT